MENLYTNYKNIVDRAIQSGIITEESRKFYLSAIVEEDGSELSELENRLNQVEEINASLKYKLKNGSSDTQGSINYENKSEGIENLSLNYDDCQSVLEGTIENYSILDIKLPKDKDLILETDSDSCSIRQEHMDTRLVQKSESTAFAKVMKKPQKYQVLDFNVPIYVDIKRNKPKIKRHSSNCTIAAKKYPPCHNLKKRSEVSEKEYKQSLTKVVLRNTKMPSIEKDNKISLKQSSDLASSNMMSERADGRDVETECLCQENKHAKKRSVHTCSKSARHENPEISNGDLKVLLDGQEVPQDKKKCQHCSKGPITNHLRPFRVPLNHERKYKMKLSCPVAWNDHQNSYTETVNDNNENDEENTCKWKQCKCNHVCKSTECPSHTINNSEAVCECENLEFNVATGKDSKEKNCDRILKVNIVCQFYQEGELKKPNDDQDKKHADSDEGPEEKVGNKVDAADLDKKDKNKKRVKTQRFAKIFSHIKMKKTQKQSLLHS